MKPCSLRVLSSQVMDDLEHVLTAQELEKLRSSYDAETNRYLLRAAGFDLLTDEELVTREPDGDVRFLWVLAQKP